MVLALWRQEKTRRSSKCRWKAYGRARSMAHSDEKIGVYSCWKAAASWAATTGNILSAPTHYPVTMCKPSFWCTTTARRARCSARRRSNSRHRLLARRRTARFTVPSAVPTDRSSISKFASPNVWICQLQEHKAAEGDSVLRRWVSGLQAPRRRRADGAKPRILHASSSLGTMLNSTCGSSIASQIAL